MRLRTILLLLACGLVVGGCTTSLKFGSPGSSGYVFEAGSGPAPCKGEKP